MQDVQNETEPQMRKGIAKREMGSWEVGCGEGKHSKLVTQIPNENTLS